MDDPAEQRRRPVPPLLPFRSRHDAGLLLGERISGNGRRYDCVVAIANGGGIVAAPIVERLACPVRLVRVSRILTPGTGDLGIGAVSADEEVLLNESLICVLGLAPQAIDVATALARDALRQEQRALGLEELSSLAQYDRVLIVDDVIATGYTMSATIRALSAHSRAELAVAVPVISGYGYSTLTTCVEQVAYIYYATESAFSGERFYVSFPEVSPAECVRALRLASAATADSSRPGASEEQV